ncbi:MAG TPA: hypothetical protein VD908_11470, partial [Cytophagales bacterium]|nr:hypothetical protein [Cytophagales bacterium]
MRNLLPIILLLFITSTSLWGQEIKITLDNRESVTDCVKGNGKLQVKVSPGSTGNYSYKWFDSEGNVISTNINASNLDVDSYTIQVTRNSDGEVASQTFALGGAMPKLTVQVDQHLTNCLTPDGQVRAIISASADASSGTYTITWYDGASTSSPLLKTSTGSIGTEDVISGLSAGSYTVEISNSTKGGVVNCTSDPITVTVIDKRVDPVISIDKNADNLACIFYTGELEGQVSGGNTGYSFEWFLGSNTLPANRVSTSRIASGLNGGPADGQVYTLKVTNNTTKCFTTAEAQVKNLISVPEATTTLLSDWTSCKVDNGSVKANVTGTFFPGLFYSFYWYNGNNELASPDHVGQTYSGLKSGNYTVVVHSNITGCKSSPVTITVDDRRVLPSAPAATSVSNTNCSPAAPNGSLTVGSPLSGHTYQWYQGASTATPIGSGITTITGLAAGTYRLVVTNSTTGCTNFKDFSVTDAIVTVTATPSKVKDLTHCTTPNGEVTANVGGITAGYTFYWYNGSVVKATPDYTGATYTGLVNGNYTVVAENNTTKCKSAAATTSVGDARVYPGIPSVTVGDQTNCTPAAVANGSLTIDSPDPATYSYQWYQGASTATPLAMGATSISGLSAGTYRLVITNKTSTCTSFKDFTIQDNIASISVSVASITPNSNCSGPGNGSAPASASGGPGGVYTFYWYIGSSVKATPDYTGATYSGLVAGSYTVVAENNQTKCKSPSVTVNVPNDFDYPEIPVVDLVNNTHCDAATPNGSLSVNAPDNATYTYQWYTGASTSSPLAAGATSVSGLAGNTYRLLITNNATGCSSFDDFTISNTPLSITVTVPAATIVANTMCITPYNGSLTAVGAGGSSYNYYW